MREELGQKTRFVQRARRRNAAAFEHQPRLRNAARGGGRFERLVFDRVLVGLRQQADRLAGERLGQLARLQFLFVARLHERLLALLFQRRERHLQLFLRRALILSAALAAEIDRRAVHAQHERGAFDRAELVAEIIRAERRERKFLFGRAFPQEIEIDVLRDGVGFLHQVAGCGFLELDQHVFRAHFRSPAARQLDLERVALLWTGPRRP